MGILTPAEYNALLRQDFGVEQAELIADVGAKQDPALAEAGNGAHLAPLQLSRIGDLVPAIGVPGRIAGGSFGLVGSRKNGVVLAQIAQAGEKVLEHVHAGTLT